MHMRSAAAAFILVSVVASPLTAQDRDTGRGRSGYSSIPFDNGYKDGYDKGREDARDRHAYDPTRHSDYRSADRGYDRRYGSKEQYKEIYRYGFRAGYEDGYRDTDADSPDRGESVNAAVGASIHNDVRRFARAVSGQLIWVV
jgi:hypothetical protein